MTSAQGGRLHKALAARTAKFKKTGMIRITKTLKNGNKKKVTLRGDQAKAHLKELSKGQKAQFKAGKLVQLKPGKDGSPRYKYKAKKRKAAASKAAPVKKKAKKPAAPRKPKKK